MKLATTIIGQATDDIIDKGRKIAGFLLETAASTAMSTIPVP